MIIIEDTRQQAGKHNIKHKRFEEIGVELIRSKIAFGDYCLPPAVSIDTKENMDEIANNICGQAHKRFINECKAAQAAGCQLIILVENQLGIEDLSQVHTWQNPRVIYSPNCVQGDRLQRAMETISSRYGVRFEFCHPSESADKIIEILGEYEYERIIGSG